LYLNALGEPKEGLSENDENTRRHLFPCALDLIRDPNSMVKYAEWLQRNHKELEAMVKLDDYYDEPKIIFSKEEMDWIESRGWYTENKNIKECLNQSIDANKNCIDRIGINKQLLSLYRNDSKKYSKEITKSKNDNEKSELEILKRKRLHKWLESLKGDVSIQVAVAAYKSGDMTDIMSDKPVKKTAKKKVVKKVTKKKTVK